MVAARSNYDLLVVGAGIAGSALVAALAGEGLRIAVVESGEISPGPPPRAAGVEEFDPRVSALTEASRRLLEQVGAWQRLAAYASPYRHMTVWDAEGTGAIEFDCDMVDSPVLGHIVENRVITWALAPALQAAGVDFIQPGRVAGMVQLPAADTAVGEPAYQLQLEDGRQLRASLLVAADGAQSTVRRLAGIETHERSYRHAAVVCTIATRLPHGDTAWQRFLPSGPLALLPLRDAGDGRHFCSIVWSTAPDHARQLLAMDTPAFSRALTVASEQRLGEVLDAGRRLSFPLVERHAGTYVRPGLALVADAAHTIHPLAGQGINLGLKDVAALASEVRRGLARGLAPGDGQLLGRYQRQRKADNLAMMAAMEGFRSLFGARALPLRWLRNAGMARLDREAGLKSAIIRRAMGI